MKSAWAVAAALVFTAFACSGPVEAHDALVPVIPGELGTGDLVGVGIPHDYRCSEGPVYNFYHGAYYGGYPTAIYRDYAYRPYYRYAAYRNYPRTYACGHRRYYGGWPRW